MPTQHQAPSISHQEKLDEVAGFCQFCRTNYAFNSGAAILMMVFQFVKDNSAIHRKITECLMSQKDDLLKDMLCVVAHGTPGARAPAADLLFYYWPR